MFGIKITDITAFSRVSCLSRDDSRGDSSYGLWVIIQISIDVSQLNHPRMALTQPLTSPWQPLTGFEPSQQIQISWFDASLTSVDVYQTVEWHFCQSNLRWNQTLSNKICLYKMLRYNTIDSFLECNTGLVLSQDPLYLNGSKFCLWHHRPESVTSG